MAVARLLVPFFALAASATSVQASAQPQAVPRTGSAQLPPASGGWADSGLVVAEGDRLSFRMQPAAPVSARFMAAFPPPTYRARAGDREFPISFDSPATAPAAGPLQLEVQYPQSRQLPPSGWPHVTIIVTDDPRPSAPTKSPGSGPNVAPTGNQVAGGSQRTIPDRTPAHGTARIVDPRPPRPPPRSKDTDWTLIALAAAALAVVVGTALALRTTAKVSAPPAVTIDPSLDKAEGAVAGDAVVPDGPEVRLRGTLELGEVRFAAGEPAMRGEAADG